MSEIFPSTPGVSRAQVHGLLPAAEPFLAEIAAAPFSDTPRLIFADWLEEQGDPRADFIRVQCARERIDEDDPQAAELAAREADLWVEHGARWMRVLPYVDDASFTFEDPSRHLGWIDNPLEPPQVLARGFPAGISVATLSTFLNCRAWLTAGLVDRVQFGPLSVDSVSELARTELLETVCELAVHLSAVASPLVRSGHLTRIERLAITTSMIDDGDLRAMVRNRGLARLSVLNLESNLLSDAAGQILAEWPHAPFTALHLPHNRLTPASVRHLVDSPHGDTLQSLDLSGARLSLVDLARRGREWPQLRRLVLDGALGDGRPEAGDWLRPMLRLERLSLTDNPWGEPLGSWLTSKAMPRLRRLNLQRTGIQAGQLAELLQSGFGGAQLRRLNLSRNPLGDEGVERLLHYASDPCLANLVELNLDRTQIGGAGLRALAKWPTSSALARISVVDNSPAIPNVWAQLRDRFGDGLRS